MKYMLVLQWPISSIPDYEAIVALETALIDALPDGSQIDGHDAGSGEMNIFIRHGPASSGLRSAQGASSRA
jgi:hypothetical protein